MVEVAYSVDPAHRRQGYATAMLRAALAWAAEDPAVKTVRASISPDNAASLATAAKLGFVRTGEQWDDEDGLELVFERPVLDVYTHGHHESVLRSHRWRTAENSAGYLLPHLDASVSLLDVGCGPGTLTMDLATRVTSVTALERSAEALELAREEAAARRATNLTFLVGDVQALDLPDDSFDVVHAHQVLQHLTDPVGALREMRRVCRPDGLLAVRDSDYGAFTWFPAVPALDDWLATYSAVARANGAEPDAGRRLLSWARAAGLRDIAATSSTWCFATPADRAWWGGLWAERIVSSTVADQALTRGLATAEDLDRIAAGWQEWAASDSGWISLLHGEVLGRP
jgi:SAM-dependent methyltransferase